MSHLRATRTTESRDAILEDNPDKEHVSANIHRQSWIFKTRESLVGHHHNLEVLEDTTSQSSRLKAQDISSSNSSSNRPSDEPRLPLDDITSSESLLPPVQPLSPMQDVAPVLGQSSTANQLSFQKQIKNSQQSQEVSLMSNRELRSLGRIVPIGSNIPVRVPDSTKVKKNIRSMREYSTEQSPSLKKTHEQNNLSEKYSGIGGLFAHLRKKTKRSEQPVSPPDLQQSCQDTSTFYEALPGLHHTPDRKVNGVYNSQNPKQFHRPAHGTVEGRTRPQHVSQLSQSLPAETSPLMLRSMSLADSRRRAYEQFVVSKEVAALSTPQLSGPVSSRTRRAVSQARKSVKTLHSYEIPDEATEMLNAELQSTAYAIKQLAASPELTTVSSTFKPVPSYAKSTAASTRRSSNFSGLSGSIARQANRKITDQRITYPPRPPSADTASPVQS